MTYYVFRNKGVMDPRSITTFGVSSKETNSPIGVFGTGLKYAISVLLRNGCKIQIRSGQATYDFHTIRATLRVNEFDFVYMDVVQPNGETAADQPLGFTTELGKGWEVWQAFRELACNAKDEDGDYFHTEDLSSALSDETWVIVSGSPFARVWADRSSIMLESAPISQTDACEVHEGPSEWIFYRGVRCAKQEKPSRLLYNITRHMDLTEDRTFKSMYMAADYMLNALKKCKSAQHINSAITSGDVCWEGNAYIEVTGAGKEFLEEAKRVFKAGTGINTHLANSIRNAHMSEFIVDLKDHLDAMDRKRLAKAVAFCKRIGFPVDKYPIIVANLEKNVLGMAMGGQIYVATRCFLLGTKQLAGTLIEEYLHLEHNLFDETRGMQNFLIDTICSLGERVTGDPL